MTLVPALSPPCPVHLISVQFSRLVTSDSLWPHGLRHARPPCPSPPSGICPSSCSLHQWCHPAISFSHALFCPQAFPASGTFPMSCLCTSDDQNPGASASTSVLPVSIQGWFPLRLTDLIMLSKGLSGIFSSTTVRRHQFFGILPSLQSSSHDLRDHWEDHSLDYQTFVSRVMSLLLNTPLLLDPHKSFSGGKWHGLVFLNSL